MKHVALLVAAFGVALPTRAGADEENTQPPAVRFEFQAVAGCAKAEDFVDQVRARTTNFRIATASEPARVFVAEVRTLPTGPDPYAGDLVVHEPDGRVSDREVTGAACDQVAVALAVIIAVELDPEGIHRPPPVAAPPSAAPEPAPPAPAPGPPSAGAPWRAGAILKGGVESAMAATPAWSAELSFELRRATGRRFFPIFRLDLEFASNVMHGEGGSVPITVFYPAFQGCPFDFALGRTFTLEPCARFGFGFYYAQGDPVGSQRGQSLLGAWSALGGVLRARWVVADPVFLELEGEVFTPFMRDRYYLTTPDNPIHQAPPVGSRGAAGVGVHFF
jgi:hypothetical protein